jgi:hypothetical protein
MLLIANAEAALNTLMWVTTSVASILSISFIALIYSWIKDRHADKKGMAERHRREAILWTTYEAMKRNKEMFVTPALAIIDEHLAKKERKI